MPFSIADWKPDEATFRWPTKTTNSNRKFVFINKSATENRIEMQLANPETAPEYLRMPFNLSQPLNPTGDNDRLTAEVAITDPVVASMFTAMDDVCIEFAVRESFKCFGKEISREAVKDRFTSPYRPTGEAGKANLLRLKLSADRVNVLRFVDFDKDTGKVRCKKGSVDLLTRGCRIAPNVEVTPLWFGAGDKQFGYSIQISDVIVDTTSSGGSGSKTAPFLMKDGMVLEIMPDDDDDTPTKPPTRRGGQDDEPSPKRMKPVGTDANITSGTDANITSGIDASLEVAATNATVNPDAYL